MIFKEKITAENKKIYQDIIDYLIIASYAGEFLDKRYLYYTTLDKSTAIGTDDPKLTLLLTKNIPSFIRKDLEDIAKTKIEEIPVEVL